MIFLLHFTQAEVSTATNQPHLVKVWLKVWWESTNKMSVGKAGLVGLDSRQTHNWKLVMGTSAGAERKTLGGCTEYVNVINHPEPVI